MGERDDDDEEFESPFARVPQPGAGPGPLQDGPVTYEKMLASVGRSARSSSRPVMATVGLVVMLSLALFALALSVVLVVGR